jgi:cytochrome P450
MTSIELYYEPWDPACREGLFDTYQRLIHEAPVYRAPSGTWVVSSYEGVEYIFSNPDLFSNRPNQDETIGFPPKVDLNDDQSVATMTRLAKLAEGLPLDFNDLLVARVIVGADPPQHTRQRKIVNRGLTARRVGMFKDRIDEIVAKCLDGIEGRDRYELVSELAIPVPVGVIADLLSVTTDRYADVRRWSDMVANLPQGEGRGSPETMFQLFGMLQELSEYFVPMIEDRRENPRDDMISDLVRAVEVDTMTVTETVLFILVVMSAGNETTTNLIGNTVVELLRNPDQLDLLLSRPELVASALEEGTRTQTPFQFLFRETLQDVDVCGTTIPKDSVIAILVGAANRDPSRFEDPDRFDITRNTPHLGFGKGIHFCLGAPLARLEAQQALTALLPHLPRFAIDPDADLELGDSLLIRGYKQIPLVAR